MLAVISGGTATNELVGLFSAIAPEIAYILPISDNGGSTSEIIRVIGGPAIGDIRSRLTRLIPPNHEPLRQLLLLRLSPDPRAAKAEWNEIVDGLHPLWRGIDASTKEIFRLFLIHVHTELLKRSKTQHASKQFRYELANVGNLFLTGARLFIGSLDLAIELFLRLAGVAATTQVLPCINTNFPYHISAVLHNGLVITGQSQISHPLENDSYPPVINTTRPPSPRPTARARASFGLALSQLSDDDDESGSTPQYIHPALKVSQLHVSKRGIAPLLSPIERVFYISPYGAEICPLANSRVTTTLAHASAIVFLIGSLMTSVVPVVILKGVGRAIVANAGAKVLLLNGCHDRETSGMDAAGFVEVLVQLVQYSLAAPAAALAPPPAWDSVVTHLLHLEDSAISVDRARLELRGVRCVAVRRSGDYYDLGDLEAKLRAIA
jgi:2-phospho-L-lactate transferase/gluconeogenesis factor (CofD/UPF0052 family)